MILVTGGTGYVGRHLLRRLSETQAEGSLRALVRDPGRTPPAEGVELLEGDITRPDSLPPALSGVTTVIHAAAITGDRKEPYPGAYDRVNRVGTENLVAAARKAGVKRILAMSGLGCKPSPPSTYMATRWGLEEAVRKSGIPYLILQPSVMFGERAPFVGALADLARWAPVLPLLGGGGVRFQPIWVEDVVSCLLAGLKSERLLGQAVAIGGSEYATFKEILETICRVRKIRRLMLPLPLAVARLQARVMTAVMPNPPLTPAAVELFEFENATDLDAVDTHFGFHPRGFREHLLEHGIDGLKRKSRPPSGGRLKTMRPSYFFLAAFFAGAAFLAGAFFAGAFFLAISSTSFFSVLATFGSRAKRMQQKRSSCTPWSPQAGLDFLPQKQRLGT
jgi:NADH dehydrogenase